MQRLFLLFMTGAAFLAAAAATYAAVGTTYEVRFNKQSLTVYIGGQLVATVTSAVGQSNAWVGIGGYNNGSGTPALSSFAVGTL